MSVETMPKANRGWSPAAFAAFWANPDPARLPGIRVILTDDIVGHWPRPIGTVRTPEAYIEVIANVLKTSEDFSLTVPEHASSGDFHFLRWIAKGSGPDGPFEFTGCDRLRVRDGLVCENYVFCDHPFFARVAAAGR